MVAAAADADAFEAKVGDATTVQFLGVAKRGAAGDEWFGIDGTKLDDPRGPFARNQFPTDAKMTHQAMLHVAGKDLDGGYAARVLGCESLMYDLTPDKDSAFILVPFAGKDRAKVDIELLIADGEWKIVGTAQNEQGHGLGDFQTEYGSIALTHLMELPGRGSMLYVAHSVEGPQMEVFAVDAQGGEHRCTNMNTGDFDKFHTMRLEYDLPPDAVVSVNVKVRPFNRKVTAKDVTLDSAKPTKPQVTVKDITDGK
jgi:hypothetical protein